MSPDTVVYPHQEMYERCECQPLEPALTPLYVGVRLAAIDIEAGAID